MTDNPSLGERRAVVRLAGGHAGRDWAGPFCIEEWDGEDWLEIGWAATREELEHWTAEPNPQGPSSALESDG